MRSFFFHSTENGEENSTTQTRTLDVVTEVKSGNNSIALIDTENEDEKSVVFRIPAPVMFDAIGAQSDAVFYELEEISSIDNLYLFMVIADKNWIEDENREFPITIAPQVVIEETENDSNIIQVTRYVSDCYCNRSSYYGSGDYQIAYDGANSYSIDVRINNPVKNAGVFDRDVRITRASLICKLGSGSSCGHFNVKVGGRIIEHFVYNNQEEIRIDVTNQMNEMIRNDGSSISVTFEPASDCDCNQYLYLLNAEKSMELLVDYLPNGVVEQNSENVLFDVKSAGQGTVNLATKNVLFEHADVTADSVAMPISVVHVFDGKRANVEHDSISYTSTPNPVTPNYRMGKGWKLNVQQMLVVPDRNVPFRGNDFWRVGDKIYLVDANGGKIIFEKQFFYLHDGVKHFVNETDCKKVNREYVIDADGCYMIDVSGVEYKVYTVYMSDNGLYLSLDQSKAMYLDEREYEKYYEYMILKRSCIIYRADIMTLLLDGSSMLMLKFRVKMMENSSNSSNGFVRVFLRRAELSDMIGVFTQKTQKN